MEAMSYMKRHQLAESVATEPAAARLDRVRGSAAQRVRLSAPVDHAGLLHLQRAAGNSAVTSLLSPRNEEVIQRLQDLTDNEWNSQGTHLAADLENGQQVDLGKFHSGAGLHAEDGLINELANRVHLGTLPAGHYQLVININRAPCSTIAGHKGCAERLIDLATKGLGGTPPTRTFHIVIHARNLYGGSSQERALSALAVEMMRHQGIEIALDPNYFDTGTAKELSGLTG